jgi:septum formation protein
MTYPIILASTSPYRKKLLEQLGLEFSALPPRIEESDYKNLNLSPKELGQKLAFLKAQSLFEENPNTCVIGSDQVCAVSDVILDKPGNFENAVEQLNLLQGKRHSLYTCVTILCPEKEMSFINETILSMRPLSLLEIKKYLNDDSPYDCAGSYKIESHGIRLFSEIQMTDFTAIIGLPLIELNNKLLQLGYTL